MNNTQDVCATYFSSAMRAATSRSNWILSNKERDLQNEQNNT